MRVLSKKVTTVFVCAILAGVLSTGCNLAYQIKNDQEVIKINGWELSSLEGNDAIRSCTAQEVTAQKYVEGNESVKVAQISGDAASVLDRVNDPFC